MRIICADRIIAMFYQGKQEISLMHLDLPTAEMKTDWMHRMISRKQKSEPRVRPDRTRQYVAGLNSIESNDHDVEHDVCIEV